LFHTAISFLRDLSGVHLDPGGTEPSEVNALIRAETACWEKVSEKAGIERQ
jgi:hypothetical protein